MLGPDPELNREAPGAPTMEIANAISHIHKQFIGRGPSNTRVVIDGDLVVALLEGGYTQAELTLGASAQEDVVVAGRAGLQAAMRDAMIGAIERTIGRSVLSFMSANDLDNNLQSEVFVLAPASAEPELA
jgi:uncharacterized protein YbcI